MLPKSYLVLKWTVYGLATLALFALQFMVLRHIQVLGVFPFIYPLFPAVVASYEGLRRGSVFGLVLGVVCDVLVFGPFDGFYTVLFTLIGLISALIAENLLAPGYLCGLVTGSAALVITGAARILLHLMGGNTHLLLMGRILLVETLLSLPALLVIVPLYRVIHQKCASEY